MLFNKLLRFIFCLFRFNRNIETLCFSIEAKQPKQTVSKQTEATLNFLNKIQKYPLYQTFLVALLFVSVQSKHRNSLLRNNRNKLLFLIVPKLVSVPQLRLFRIETSFEKTPYLCSHGAVSILLTTYSMFHVMVKLSFPAKTSDTITNLLSKFLMGTVQHLKNFLRAIAKEYTRRRTKGLLVCAQLLPLHRQSWAPTMEKLSENRHPTNRNQQRPPTATPDNQKPENDDRQRHPTTRNQQRRPTETPDNKEPAMTDDSDTRQQGTSNDHRQRHPTT